MAENEIQYPVHNIKMKKELHLCTSEDFNNNPFERKSFSSLNTLIGEFIYCLDESFKEIYLEGTKDDFLIKKSYSYLDIKVETCNEKSQNIGDPECSSP